MGSWPPEGVVLPSMPLASLATGVLLASSITLRTAIRRGRTGAPGFLGWWCTGLALGTAFAGLQAWLWLDLLRAGRFADTGLYESLFYGLTWVHAAHVVIGLAALVWIATGIRSGRYGPHLISTPANAAIW